jgi:hypothetical protein
MGAKQGKDFKLQGIKAKGKPFRLVSVPGVEILADD